MVNPQDRSILIGQRIVAARESVGYDRQKDFTDALRKMYPDIRQERVSDAERGNNRKWQNRIIEFLVEECGIKRSYFDTQLPATYEERISELERQVAELLPIKKAIERLFRDVNAEEDES